MRMRNKSDLFKKNCQKCVLQSPLRPPKIQINQLRHLVLPEIVITPYILYI